MTFLNAIMLLGLAAVAIPIIIHILNRRRAQLVDWAAMQFLEESLTSRSRRILIEEILLMLLRCLLLGMLAFALARPFLRTGRLLVADTADAQDIAIVLDGSLSMTLESAGASSFQRAADEARQVLEVCRAGDAVSVVLAGPTAQPVVATPLSDLDAVRRELEGLRPAGGSMDVPRALNEAVRSLAAGSNLAKKIILITDGHKIGWDLDGRKRWAFLAEEAKESLPAAPVVIVRTLQIPKQWRNVCVGGLRLARAVVGTDRPVRISVTVANTGVGDLEPEGVRLAVDGVELEARLPTAGGQARPTGRIAEGASATVEFDHHFKASGPHVVSAAVLCPDDLPGDNQALHVVNVLKRLPVLVIAGERSTRPLGGDADFLQIALAPPSEERPDPAENLIEPKLVVASDVASVKDFDEYSVVVLADVPRLPASAAERLARYVQGGGGVLIAPGQKADKDFYSGWTGPDGKRITGCRLVEFIDLPVADGAEQRFVHVAPNTIDHPALKLLADPSVSDLASAQIKRRWVLASDDEPGVSVGAAMDNAEPYLIQRQAALGFVLTLAVPLDREFSDLPVHECYLPMVHELVYYLAAPSQPPMNIQPGQQIAFPIPGQISHGDVAEVFTPDGQRHAAELRQRRPDAHRGWLATFSHTAAAGLYRLALPDKALGELATRPAVARNADGVGGVPFVVPGNPEESKLLTLAPEDYARAAEFVDLKRAETLSELTHAIKGGVPGSEIWRVLAVLCAALLLAEILTTRAIALRRQVHLARPVAFGTDQADVEAFRERARQLLQTPSPRKEVPAK